jgi:hypothetical protein
MGWRKVELFPQSIKGKGEVEQCSDFSFFLSFSTYFFDLTKPKYRFKRFNIKRIFSSFLENLVPRFLCLWKQPANERRKGWLKE